MARAYLYVEDKTSALLSSRRNIGLLEIIGKGHSTLYSQPYGREKMGEEKDLPKTHSNIENQSNSDNTN